jgi:hypothetical protein
MVDERQERAFADCRAKAAPILAKSGELMGRIAYQQAIADCMSAQGYTKL